MAPSDAQKGIARRTPHHTATARAPPRWQQHGPERSSTVRAVGHSGERYLLRRLKCPITTTTHTHTHTHDDVTPRLSLACAVSVMQRRAAAVAPCTREEPRAGAPAGPPPLARPRRIPTGGGNTGKLCDDMNVPMPPEAPDTKICRNTAHSCQMYVKRLKPRTTCKIYCGDHGMACINMYEDAAESCKRKGDRPVADQRSCGSKGRLQGNTRGFICQCGPIPDYGCHMYAAEKQKGAAFTMGGRVYTALDQFNNAADTADECSATEDYCCKHPSNKLPNKCKTSDGKLVPPERNNPKRYRYLSCPAPATTTAAKPTTTATSPTTAKAATTTTAALSALEQCRKSGGEGQPCCNAAPAGDKVVLYVTSVRCAGAAGAPVRRRPPHPHAPRTIRRHYALG